MNIPEIYQPVQPQPGRMVIPEEYQPEQDPNGKLSKGQHFDQYKKDKAESWWTDFKQIGGNVLPGMGHGVDMVKDANTDKDSFFAGLFKLDPEAYKAAYGGVMTGTHDITRIGKAAISNLMDEFGPEEDEYEREWIRYNQNFDYWTKVRPEYIKSKAFGGEKYGPQKELLSFLDPTIILPGFSASTHLFQQTVGRSFRAGMKVTAAGAGVTSRGLGYLGKGVGAVGAAPRKILDKIPGGKAIAGGAYGAGGVALASGAAPVIGGTVAAFGAMDVFGHLAAKVGMEVGEVARVLSTPSGHKRFLQKIATDQAVSPKIRKAAAITHKLGGTKMGDIIFDTILAGATTASIQAALAKASGATDEEAGAAAGLGVAMGGPMGMALGPRGAGKDVAALNHLGGMTGRSKVSTQGFLEEKAHMVKMEDWKKLPDHSKVLLATLEEIGAGGIKTEIVPGDAYLRFLQEKAAAANKPLPKDTPAAHFDQGLRKIYIDGDNLQRGGREAASVFAHEAGHAFLFDLLGKDPASTRRVLEPFRDDENGKEFWFSFDKDGNGIGDPIKLNKEAVDFAESYAAEAISLGDTSAAVLKDASLLGQEIGAEHFGAMFARNPNVWAAINPGLRQKMGKAAKAVFAAIGLADPVTGNPLPSPWAKKMKANKEINRLFKNHLKFREWQLNQRAEDVSTGTRVDPGKGQTTAAAFTNLYGGMGMSMKDANNFYISDKNMFNELKAVDALVEGSGDPNYVGIGKGKEGKKIHSDMLKLFTFNDPLGNAKAIIDFVQRSINERRVVKFGYRSGSRWKRGEYNPFYERNVTPYAWQVSPKTYSWTGKRKSQPTLKMMGFDADKLAINVEILSQKGLLSEWDSPQAFLDALGEHAQKVLAPDGLEGRINPDGIGENSLFAAAFGIEGTAAAPNLRPDLKQLLADGSLTKTIVSYDLPALAGMASENKPGYAFDYRHIRDNYMPKMAGMGDIATVNKHTPQRTPEPVTLFKQPPATGVDRLLFAPKENLAKREKPEVNKLILEMDGAEAAMKDLNERRGRAAATAATARTREAVTREDARRRREARGEPMPPTNRSKSQTLTLNAGKYLTQPGVEKADLVTVLPVDHRVVPSDLPMRNERVQMSTSEAIKWGEAGEIDKVFFDGKSTPWDEARPLLMEKAGGENTAAMATFLDGLYQKGQGRVDAVSRIFRTITEEYADDAFKLGSVPKNLKDKSLHNLVKVMGKGKVKVDIDNWSPGEPMPTNALGSIFTEGYGRTKGGIQGSRLSFQMDTTAGRRTASIGTTASKTGGGGGHLYAIFFEFLAQNDIVNTGEMLTPLNEFRRLSNATGSALRHGTTKHVNVSRGESMGVTDAELAVLPSGEGGRGVNARDIIIPRSGWAPPSADQLNPSARHYIENELELGNARMPFDEPGEMGAWKYGEDFNRDIAGRLIGELYEVDSRLSRITEMYEYDFDSGKFSRKGSGEGTFDRTGGTISAKEMVEHIENVASQTERPGYHETDATYGKGNWSHGVGLSTLRRAIITRNALERAETYGRATDPSLLDPQWHKEGKGLPEDMQDIFYSPKVTYLREEYMQGPGELTPRGKRRVDAPPFFKKFDLSDEAGGRFVDIETGENFSNQTFASGDVSIINGRAVAEVSPGRADPLPKEAGPIVRSNLFKRSAGWKWIRGPKDKPDTLVSVQKGGEHFYTLSHEIDGPIKLNADPKSDGNPRGKTETRGEVELGEKVGSIKVQGRKTHPVYDKISVAPAKLYQIKTVSEAAMAEGFTAVSESLDGVKPKKWTQQKQVFHGSPNKGFREFKVGEEKSHEWSVSTGEALHFSTRENEAAQYTETWRSYAEDSYNQVKVGEGEVRSFFLKGKYFDADKGWQNLGHESPISPDSSKPYWARKSGPEASDGAIINRILDNGVAEIDSATKQWLISKGYDGMFKENKTSGYAAPDGSTEFAVFDPKNVKSADPTTYDSSGNTIPMSERFSDSNDAYYIPKTNKGQTMALEFTPGDKSKFMEGIAAGPMALKLEWHQRHLDVLTNDTGEFLPAKYLGIKSNFENFPSAYINDAGKLEINPVAMLELLGAKKGDVQMLASVMGRMTFQEAVAGYNRSYTKTGEHDAFHVKVGEGRNISEQEMSVMQTALFKQLGPAVGDLAIFPHLAGFDVKWLGYNNLGVTKDAAFGAMTQELGNILAKTNESLEGWDFRTGDTIYESNNWKQFPNGEEYLATTRNLASVKGRASDFISKPSRRSTFQQWVDDQFAPGIGEIHSDFQARGYGESGKPFVSRHLRRAAPDSLESKGGFLFETTHHHAEAMPGELSIPKKSIGWKQEHWDKYFEQGKLADDIQRALADAGANPESWKEIFQTRLEGVEGAKLPVFASRLGEWVNNPQELAKIISEAFQKNPDLIRKSKEGIEAAREMHQVAREGRLVNEAVASSFFWGFLSRMLDPYNQEAGWLRMTSKVGFWKQLWKSVDGTFDMPRGEYWTGAKAALEAIHGETNIVNAAFNAEVRLKNKTRAKNNKLKERKIHKMEPADFNKLSKGKRKKYTRMAKERNLTEQPGTWVDLVANTFEKQNTDNFLSTGQNATQNINGAYDLFQKWNGRWDEVTAVLNDAELTGPQMREKFWEMGLEGAGIGDKVTSFVIATLARGDVLIMDRWQFVNLWLNEISQAAKDLPGRVMEKAWAAKEAAGKARRAGDTAGVSKQKAKMRELREQFNDWKEHGGNPFRMDSRGVPEDRSNFYDTVGSKAEGVESHALYRNLEIIFEKLSNDVSRLTPELSWLNDAFSLHWLTWNIIKNEAVGHSSLDVITHMSKNDLFPNDKSKRGQWLRSFFGAEKFTERLWAQPGKPKRTQRFRVNRGARVAETNFKTAKANPYF